jgi:hypothetical protein
LSCIRLYKLLLAIVIFNKFPLANMRFFLACNPHFVREAGLLTLGMLVWTTPVHTRVEFACCGEMGELASFGGAVGSIPAERHAGMFEMTMRVGAVREKAAYFFCLVR